MQEEIADPNRPKRPRPAYFIFSTEKMAELRAKDGEGATQSGAAYAKLVGALWRDMGDDQKVRGDPSATNLLNCCCWLAFTNCSVARFPAFPNQLTACWQARH